VPRGVYKRTPEYRAIMSKAMSDKKHSEASKAKMSLSKLGKKRKPFSEQTKKRMSESHKKMVANKNNNWKGGRNFCKSIGYIYVHCPNHPNSNHKGYVLEHRYVMSKNIKRPLRDNEIVHHINGDTTDNRIENLILMLHGEHSAMHRKVEHSLKSSNTPKISS